MLASFKRLFTNEIQQEPTEALRLAGALLMLEVAAADFELSDTEQMLLKNRLQERFGLSADTLERLIDEAMSQHDLAVSLHEQIALLNAHYDAAAKRQLIYDLWCIAYADGELHHYEEAVIRRLADLLYVPHKDFIQTKHDVTGQQ